MCDKNRQNPSDSDTEHEKTLVEANALLGEAENYLMILNRDELLYNVFIISKSCHRLS